MTTPNGTQFQVATDSGFATKQVDYNGVYKTSHLISTGVMTRGVLLYARVRHSSTESGFSAWGPTRQFSIAQHNRYVKVLLTTSNKLYGRAVVQDATGNIYALAIERTESSHVLGYDSAMVLIKYSYAGAVIWKKKYTTPLLYTVPMSMIIDDDGYLYVSGQVYTGINILNGFIMKLSNDGGIVWQCTLRDAVNNRYVGFTGHMIAFGAFVYVVGVFYATASVQKGLIVKYERATGNLVWQKSFSPDFGGYNFNAICNAVAVDSGGNIYVGGHYTPDTTYTIIAFVIRLGSNGNHLWTRCIPSTAAAPFANSTITSICVANNSYLYVSGAIGDSTWSTQIPFIACIQGPSAEYIWSRSFPPLFTYMDSHIAFMKLNTTTGILYVVGYDYSSSTVCRGFIFAISTSNANAFIFAHSMRATNNTWAIAFRDITQLSTDELCFSAYLFSSSRASLIPGLIPSSGNIGVGGPILNLTDLEWLTYPITPGTAAINVTLPTLGTIDNSPLTPVVWDATSSDITLTMDATIFY